MKIIDEKGRLFGKINIIDLCLVLVVLFAAAGFFLKGSSSSKNQTTYQSITYTVKVSSVRENTAKHLEESIGKGATSAKTGEELGTVVDVVTEDAEDFAVDKNGQYIKSTPPGRYDVTVTFTTDGTKTAKGIYTQGGKQLFVGEDLPFATDTVDTTGEVMDIKVEEK